MVSDQEEARFQDDKRLQESQVEAELGRDDSEGKTMADTRHSAVTRAPSPAMSAALDRRERRPGKTCRPLAASIRLRRATELEPGYLNRSIFSSEAPKAAVTSTGFIKYFNK